MRDEWCSNAALYPGADVTERINPTVGASPNLGQCASKPIWLKPS
jgi:hypothetical protein